ncbi:MAG: hypothetical protein LQ348_003429 [Seirophora lacunosa]|nr:MAG: hypothetical protein LQ344_004939 [Seirophora lacunosa]KAI4191777.1 MAG: hypothetical protein LQ348_003429 [Seirophora lacunosa]
MSNPYEGQDPLVIAQQAERDLNSHQAKHGDYNKSSSAVESGVDEGVTSKFPQSTVKTGSQASGAGDNREIPVDEGGDLISKPGEKGGSGHPTKARDFEGPGGPETKQQLYEEANPGNDDVMGNVRQGTETRRP